MASATGPRNFTLDQLWASIPAPGEVWTHSAFSHLPASALRYLNHSIAPGTPLASGVRLRMQGQIKLGKWWPFEADEVIHRQRGFLWQGTVRMYHLPVRGFDRLLDGEGLMRWKLLGLVPIAAGSGPDVSRSACGRLAGEVCWLPSALAGPGVRWTGTGEAPHVRFDLLGQAAALHLALRPSGALQSVSYLRWGNPAGGDFRELPFGMIAEEEKTFAGYTIPTRVRVGWYFGTDRFAAEGEFFRGVIKHAEFR